MYSKASIQQKNYEDFIIQNKLLPLDHIGASKTILFDTPLKDKD